MPCSLVIYSHIYEVTEGPFPAIIPEVRAQSKDFTRTSRKFTRFCKAFHPHFYRVHTHYESFHVHCILRPSEIFMTKSMNSRELSNRVRELAIALKGTVLCAEQLMAL